MIDYFRIASSVILSMNRVA